MAIRRRKPQSNVARQKAMTTAKERKDNLANPADNVLTASTEARLDAHAVFLFVLKILEFVFGTADLRMVVGVAEGFESVLQIPDCRIS